MEHLNEKEFNSRAKTVFDSVFVNANPYGKPFRPIIYHKLLLYSFRWTLEEPWLDPIVKSIKLMGEQGFYVTAFYRADSEEVPINYDHWYIPLNEIDKYTSELILQENAIYSLSGQWGIVCSDYDHALLGGPQLLVDEIQRSVPDLDYRVKEFLDVCKDYNNNRGVDLDWLLPQLEHIYGFEKAKLLLDYANLSWLLKN